MIRQMRSEWLFKPNRQAHKVQDIRADMPVLSPHILLDLHRDSNMGITVLFLFLYLK